ncbi:DDE-type integrase/transposase/recombinase [Brevibacterium sp. FAM 27836]|uniref:DDE-type integrase/transposase/recombinase n=1 Tax=Brevibacterium sp. FAM 27836 TaxID=3446693 RepID=UPI003F51A410
MYGAPVDVSVGIRRDPAEAVASESCFCRAEEWPDDLVKREYTATGPNCVRSADITCVPTAVGRLYTTSIFDVFHREIVDWQVTNHTRKSLAGGALTMALAAKYRDGEDASELVHHSDQGVHGRFAMVRAAQSQRSWRL